MEITFEAMTPGLSEQLLHDILYDNYWSNQKTVK